MVTVTKKRVSKSKPSAKSRPAKAPKPKQLDDNMSALVFAEYAALDGAVDESVINKILNTSSGLSPREIAITFRMSEVLGVPDAFDFAPRFRIPFRVQRAVYKVHDQLRNEQRNAFGGAA